jgi:hypothetical protein
MNRLHKDTDSEKANGIKGSEERETKGVFSKWLLAPGAGVVLALSLHACGDRTIDNYVPIPPNSQHNDGGVQNDGGPDADTDADITDAGNTDGGSDGGSDGGTDGGDCVPVEPVCTPQTVSGLLNSGDILPIGDFNFRLETTDEAAGEQRAIVDVLDSCHVLVGSSGDNVPINENATVTFGVVTTVIEIDVTATQVMITDPKRARLAATMRCLVTDGGTDTDAHVDGGASTDADVDTDTGPGMDAGTDADTDLDGGASTDADVDTDADTGLDGGASTDADVDMDADTDADTGPIADAGPDLDADTDADTGGDTGTDGGPADGGVTDGGTTDGGTLTCPGAANGFFSSSIDLGAEQVVGSYIFSYAGLSLDGKTILNVACIGGTSVSVYQFDPGVVTTVDIPVDGKRLRVTPHMSTSTVTSVTIIVEDMPPVSDGGVSDGGTADGGVPGPVCIEATVGNFSSTIHVGSTETVGGYVFTYLGINGDGAAIFDITCGGSPVQTGYAFPQGEKTTIIVTDDHKRIEVTPHISVPAVTSVSIEVREL